MRTISSLASLHLALLLSFLAGCATGPEITGYPVNTPKYYSENKVFFVKPLPTELQHIAKLVDFQHLYEVTTDDARLIRPNDPLSVVLQGVRLPEDLPGGPRDIAVVLDIYTGSVKGVITLVAFYQRDVRPGQMLNFNNLLVYADSMWDASTPPWFRVRVLDVKAERSRVGSILLEKISNLSGQVGGVVPHPVIPAVTSAIDAASLLLKNRRNQMILDFQISFYSPAQVAGSGGATLGPLMAGPWLVVGRGQNADSSFWAKPLSLDRKTDRIVEGAHVERTSSLTNVPVPYVSMVLLRADAEVPKMVLERSASLIGLLSTPNAKSDLDALDQIKDNLASAIDGYSIERRLRKNPSKVDLDRIISILDQNETGVAKLNANELNRLLFLLSRLVQPPTQNSTPRNWIEWWKKNGGAQGQFEDAPQSPFGFLWKWGQKP